MFIKEMKLRNWYEKRLEDRLKVWDEQPQEEQERVARKNALCGTYLCVLYPAVIVLCLIMLLPGVGYDEVFMKSGLVSTLVYTILLLAMARCWSIQVATYKYYSDWIKELQLLHKIAEIAVYVVNCVIVLTITIQTDVGNAFSWAVMTMTVIQFLIRLIQGIFIVDGSFKASKTFVSPLDIAMNVQDYVYKWHCLVLYGRKEAAGMVESIPIDSEGGEVNSISAR